MLIFGSLSGVYIIPTIYDDYTSLEHAARKGNSLDNDSKEHITRRASNADEFARNALSAVHIKAKEIKANSSVVSVFFRIISVTLSLPPELIFAT